MRTVSAIFLLIFLLQGICLQSNLGNLKQKSNITVSHEFDAEDANSELSSENESEGEEEVSEFSDLFHYYSGSSGFIQSGLDKAFFTARNLKPIRGFVGTLTPPPRA